MVASPNYSRSGISRCIIRVLQKWRNTFQKPWIRSWTTSAHTEICCHWWIYPAPTRWNSVRYFIRIQVFSWCLYQSSRKLKVIKHWLHILILYGLTAIKLSKILKFNWSIILKRYWRQQRKIQMIYLIYFPTTADYIRKNTSCSMSMQRHTLETFFNC